MNKTENEKKNEMTESAKAEDNAPSTENSVVTDAEGKVELKQVSEPDAAEILIKFSAPNEIGEVSTTVEAKGMSIRHFNHLVSVAQWYIENEFPEEEREKLNIELKDTIEERTEEHD